MTRPSARTAVLIGNGAFPQAEGALTPLAAPAHDVAVLTGLLADPEVCRFDPPQTLVDRDAKTIKQSLLRTLNAAGPRDLVLVYYAGHGKLDGAQLYLCAYDTEPETLAATAVSISEIRDYVSRSACRQVVLILDCCFSGAAADEFRSRGDLSDRIEAATSARGLYLLTSCANHETSLEHVGPGQDDVPYGIYTRMLADGILSGQADIHGDGRITPLELAKYLQSRIPGQTPRVSLIDAEGEEPVLAWTSWAQDDSRRKRVRTRLTQWFAEETVPDEVFYQAMSLLGRVPQNAVERRRKRLLGMCAESGWDDVFARGWLALEAEPADPAAGLERFLTEHVANGALDPGLYLETMRLLAAEPQDELQRRRKRLLARFGRSPERDVTVLVDAWQALGSRLGDLPAPSHPADDPPAPRPADDPPAPRPAGDPPAPPPADDAPVPRPADAPAPPPAADPPAPEPPYTPAAPGSPDQTPRVDHAAPALPAPAPRSGHDRPPALEDGANLQVGPDESYAAAEGPGENDTAGGWELPGAPPPSEPDPVEAEARPVEKEPGESEANPVIVDTTGVVWDPASWRLPAPEAPAPHEREVDVPGQNVASELRRDLKFVGFLLLVVAIVLAAKFARSENRYDDAATVVTADTMMAASATDTRADALSPPPRSYPARPDDQVDFHEIGGVLQRMRFYEDSASSQLVPGGYGYRFRGSTARFISYDLLVAAPDTLAEPPQVRVESVWYDADGTRIVQDTFTLTPGMNPRPGYGWYTPGNWSPGVYRVEILHQQQRIAMAAFEILADSAQLHEFPEVEGRVTNLSFYDLERPDTTMGIGPSRPLARFNSLDPIALSSWLRFDHPPARGERAFTVDVVYSDWNGREIARASSRGVVQPGATYSTISFPARQAQQWAQGTYRAEWYMAGKRIATGFFDVF